MSVREVAKALRAMKGLKVDLANKGENRFLLERARRVYSETAGFHRQRLDELTGRLIRGMGAFLNISREQAVFFQARLASLNPEAILKRGYAMVTAEDGSTIYEVGQTSSGQQLQVRVSDGEFEVVVS